MGIPPGFVCPINQGTSHNYSEQETDTNKQTNPTNLLLQNKLLSPRTNYDQKNL